MNRLRVVLAVVVLVLAALVPMAAPADASPAAPVTRCDVSGSVAVTGDGVFPSPPGGRSSGGYVVTQMTAVCAGGIVGVFVPVSVGSRGVPSCGGTDVPLIGSFCGNYAGLGPCNGNVGGDEVSAPSPAALSSGDWSSISGTHIQGGITCNSGGVGTLDLNATPDPLHSNSFDSSCNQPPPLTAGAPAPVVWYCGFSVAGDLVIVG